MYFSYNISILIELFITYVKGIDKDVKHRKIFTMNNILAVFIFLNMTNLLLLLLLFIRLSLNHLNNSFETSSKLVINPLTSLEPDSLQYQF